MRIIRRRRFTGCRIVSTRISTCATIPIDPHRVRGSHGVFVSTISNTRQPNAGEMAQPELTWGKPARFWAVPLGLCPPGSPPTVDATRAPRPKTLTPTLCALTTPHTFATVTLLGRVRFAWWASHCYPMTCLCNCRKMRTSLRGVSEKTKKQACNKGHQNCRRANLQSLPGTGCGAGSDNHEGNGVLRTEAKRSSCRYQLAAFPVAWCACLSECLQTRWFASNDVFTVPVANWISRKRHSTSSCPALSSIKAIRCTLSSV